MARILGCLWASKTIPMCSRVALEWCSEHIQILLCFQGFELLEAFKLRRYYHLGFSLVPRYAGLPLFRCSGRSLGWNATSGYPAGRPGPEIIGSVDGNSLHPGRHYKQHSVFQHDIKTWGLEGHSGFEQGLEDILTFDPRHAIHFRRRVAPKGAVGYISYS
jgi:hypothetical protein